MIEQQGNALVFYAMFIASKVGATGLTVTCDVYRNSTEIVTAGSATEVGDGLYKYSLASGSNNAEGEYIAVFKTADATVDQQHIPAMWVVEKAGIENLDAAVSSRSTVTTEEVNAEVVDVLTTDTFAEPAAVPAATSSLKDKINWLFTLARNKVTQTSTTQTLRNDADGANIGTSTVSDDGATFTRGEWS